MTAGATIFVDGILDANVTFGVARLMLTQTSPERKLVAAGQLIVPLVQMSSVVNSETSLLEQSETRMREQQVQQQAGVPEGAACSAFRFG